MLFEYIATIFFAKKLSYVWGMYQGSPCHIRVYRHNVPPFRGFVPITGHTPVFRASTVLVDLVLLIVEVSRSHSDTPHSLGLLWTVIGPSQRLLPDNTQHLQETDIHDPGGIRTLKPSKRGVGDPRRKPRGDWGRPTSL
jgi:hypothetical protein